MRAPQLAQICFATRPKTTVCMGVVLIGGRKTLAWHRWRRRRAPPPRRDIKPRLHELPAVEMLHFALKTP